MKRLEHSPVSPMPIDEWFFLQGTPVIEVPAHHGTWLCECPACENCEPTADTMPFTPGPGSYVPRLEPRGITEHRMAQQKLGHAVRRDLQRYPWALIGVVLAALLIWRSL